MITRDELEQAAGSYQGEPLEFIQKTIALMDELNIDIANGMLCSCEDVPIPELYVGQYNGYHAVLAIQDLSEYENELPEGSYVIEFTTTDRLGLKDGWAETSSKEISVDTAISLLSASFALQKAMKDHVDEAPGPVFDDMPWEQNKDAA